MVARSLLLVDALYIQKQYFGLLLGSEALVMTRHGLDFSLLSFLLCCAMLCSLLAMHASQLVSGPARYVWSPIDWFLGAAHLRFAC